MKDHTASILVKFNGNDLSEILGFLNWNKLHKTVVIKFTRIAGRAAVPYTSLTFIDAIT